MKEPTAILKAMDNLISVGKQMSPRGQKTIEVMNYQWEVDYPFSSFISRRFSLKYLKQEFLWYLTGDPYNDSILEASTQWGRFRQPEGNWFSNYGQYWFADTGIEWVVDQLTRDSNSRQAIIPMLQPKHVFEGNVDVVCTSYVNFHIRDGKLLMSVRMRSSDIIWGYGNDIPCFWWLHEMVAARLGIPTGTYTHSSDSLHVYEKHFGMINGIVDSGMRGFYELTYPAITDPQDLIDNAKSHNFKSDFGKWLLEE